jgi:dinuclear metal center YbgI/SA1388 family protein
MPCSLAKICTILEELAPLGLAESWDNPGLLVEPDPDAEIDRVLLTIDLTTEVLHEALERRARLILAYHPLTLKGLRRLRASEPEERLWLGLIRANIAVYSPHTALDAARGGMNDWLAEALGPGQTTPIVPASGQSDVGMGRRVRLETPLSLDEAKEKIRAHLGLTWLRLALGAGVSAGSRIQTLGVCAGSGGSVFSHLDDVDLCLTGEMRHHDILARVARGTSVILTDHTNTERGYLKRWSELLRGHLPEVEFPVASRDRDPLQVV